MSYDNEQLAIEMAAISAVHSAELVEMAGSASELNRIQTQLTESRDRVGTVKQLLQSVQPHEVTTDLAKSIDNQMSRLDVLSVNGDDVQGVEALGLSLLPADYLKQRIKGCEGFLDSFSQKLNLITREIGTKFKDAYVLLAETHESLETRIKALETDLQAMGKFGAGTSEINLGYRLYNLFQVNREIREDWVNQLGKVSNTVGGLSSNYYVNAKTNMNTILSYFGGFEGLDEDKATARYLEYPISIPSIRFKECSFPDKTRRENYVKYYVSVEMMGGRYFMDSRQTDPRLHPGTIDEVNTYIDTYLEVDGVAFNDKPDREFSDLKHTVKSLGSDEIKEIIKQMRAILKNWEKIYVDGDKYKLADRDFEGIYKSIQDADWDNQFKHYVLAAFSATVRKHQDELLQLRSRVNAYLVFLINGMVEFCYASMKVNQPEE